MSAWRRMLWAVLLILAGVASGEAQAQAAAAGQTSPGGRRVAVTFDDLPWTAADARGGCDVKRVEALNAQLLARLAAHRIPAAGLVVADRACGAAPGALLERVLRAWLDAGHTLGNHTASHRSLNRVELGWYQADIERGGEPVARLLRERGQRLRYFRPPQLHTGDTEEKKRGLERFLAARGYALAPVTIDNQEWVFAAVYARAKERGDEALARRVVPAYLTHLEESFAFYEQLSRSLLGREVPQVLLLHANLLNADHLDAVVEVMRRRGYRFVSLEEALGDAAYRLPDGYIGPRGLSWLQRWALTQGKPVPAEPREPPWLTRLLDEG